MKKDWIPFGFNRTPNNEMRITLRYKTDKFLSSGLVKYNCHRHLHTGTTLFDIVVSVDGPQHIDIEREVSKLRLSK